MRLSRPGQPAAAPSASATPSDRPDERERIRPAQHIRARPGEVRGLRQPAVGGGACSGFEYGYSLDEPDTLVMWEAQFGDFANGAQVIIDQFIASGESSGSASAAWCCCCRTATRARARSTRRARLERFLQLCAERQHAGRATRRRRPNTSTLLRRQVQRNFRKPLIVMTPKSLLRHKLAVSPLDGARRRHASSRDRRGRPIGGDRAGPPRRALQRQGVLRPARGARAKRRSTTSRSCGSSSCTRSRRERWPTVLARYREAPRSSGARRSRRTGRLDASSTAASSRRCAARQRGQRPLRRARADGASPATGSHKAHISPSSRPRSGRSDALGPRDFLTTACAHDGHRSDQGPGARARSVTEATLARWHKKAGEPSRADEPLIELETDKVDLEVRAGGRRARRDQRARRATVEVGDVLAPIDAGASAHPAPKPAPAPRPRPPPTAPAAARRPAPRARPRRPPTARRPTPAMPAAAKLIGGARARRRQVAGTGKDGRITKGDVLAVPRRARARRARRRAAPRRAPAAPIAEPREQRVPMTRLRRRSPSG